MSDAASAPLLVDMGETEEARLVRPASPAPALEMGEGDSEMYVAGKRPSSPLVLRPCLSAHL